MLRKVRDVFCSRSTVTQLTLITLVALSMLWTIGPAPSALAGHGAPSGAHYNLNIIGVDKPKNADMDDSQRHTIFVPLTGNCFDGDGAEFQLPNPDPDGDGTTDYSVFARALGKPGGSSVTTTCATDPVDGSLVCSVISLTLTRTAGQTQFQNATKYLLYIYADIDGDGDLERVSLFDPALVGYFWDYDNNGLRLAQLRFYDCPTTVPAASDPGGAQSTECIIK